MTFSATAPTGSHGHTNGLPAMTELPDRSPLEPLDDTEMVPEDDAVIGRAFRWSLAVLVVLGVVAGVVAVIVNRPREVAPPAPAGSIEVVVPVRTADPPSVVFTDITAEAGIGFVHTNGAVETNCCRRRWAADALFSTTTATATRTFCS